MDKTLPLAASETRDTEGASAGGLRSDTVTLRRRLVLGLPLLGVTGLLAVFASRLGQDPSLIPSALIGKSVPQFDLPPVEERMAGLSSADLRGGVSLVNVFASWCVACREEHPFLTQLAASRTIPINGLNYKDAPADAAAWLDANGDPYSRTGADITGKVAIDWGVYGVPETYVIDAGGRIAYKAIGPLNAEIFARTIEPVLRKLGVGSDASQGALG